MLSPRDCPNHRHGLRRSHGLETSHGNLGPSQPPSEPRTLVDEAILGGGELEGPQEVGDLTTEKHPGHAFPEMWKRDASNTLTCLKFGPTV